MKQFYLVNLTQYDGEHEHAYKFIATAKNEPELIERLTKEQVYDCGDPEPPTSLLAFGDGLTGVRLAYVQEIPESDYAILSNYLGRV